MSSIKQTYERTVASDEKLIVDLVGSDKNEMMNTIYKATEFYLLDNFPNVLIKRMSLIDMN